MNKKVIYRIPWALVPMFFLYLLFYVIFELFPKDSHPWWEFPTLMVLISAFVGSLFLAVWRLLD